MEQPGSATAVESKKQLIFTAEVFQVEIAVPVWIAGHHDCPAGLVAFFPERWSDKAEHPIQAKMLNMQVLKFIVILILQVICFKF